MAKKQKSSAKGSAMSGKGAPEPHDARTIHASRADVSVPSSGPPSAPPPSSVSIDATTTKKGADLSHDGMTLKRDNKKLTSTGPNKPKLPGNKGGADKKPADKQSTKLGVDVAVLWRGDMLTAQFFAKPQVVSAGPKGIFVVPEDAIGGDKLVLVEPHASARFGLRVDGKKAAGHLIVDGDVHDIADVRDGKVDGVRGPVIPLTGGTRAVLVFGDFTFIISRVPVPPPAKFAFFDRRIIPFAISWTVAFLMTTIPLIMAFNSPEWRNRAKLSYLQKQEQRIAELEYIDVQEEEKPQEEEEKEEEEKKEETPIKQDEKKEEKKEEEEVKQEVNKIEKALDNLDEEKKAEVVKEMVDKAAKQTEALDDALAQIDQQAIGTRLFAESDDGGGESTANPDEGSGGAQVIADPTGATAGLAAVAGAKKEDRLGGKSATTRGKIASLEKNKKAGKDVKIGLKARAQKVVRVGGSRSAKASGELPKKVIKRYIARKMGAIKACYQKGLQSNPSLSGKVKVKFLIAPTGAVTGVKVADSGLNSPAVENCIVRNIKTWKFPRAKGGGSTMVVYPFVFSRR